MTSRSDCSKIGFRRSEIVALLREHGIDVEPAEHRSPRVEVVAFPTWKLALATMPTLTTWEAAHALADDEPERQGNFHFIAPETAAWEAALRRALESKDPYLGDGGPTGGRIPADGFRSWCAAKGIVYPLEVSAGPPLTDPELRAELQREREKVADLTAKVVELKARAERAEAQVERSVDAPGSWPWGAYDTDMLRALRATAEKFWTNYEPSDKTTAVTKAVIVAWLKREHGCSDSKARAIDTILRADDAPGKALRG